jgi:chromosome partitioning protein
MRQLEDTLALVAAMEENVGYQCKVRIVPLGVTKINIYEHLASLTMKPQNLEISQRINKHPHEFSKSLQQGEYIWNYSGCEYIRDILQNVVT